MSKKDKKPSFIHVYVDGSAKLADPKKRNSQTKIGMGWLIVRDDSIEPEIYAAKALINKDDRSRRHELSLIAEFTAANLALTSIERGSRIILHTDHTYVARAIEDYRAWKDGTLNNTFADSRMEAIAANLYALTQIHEIVIAKVVNDRTKDAPFDQYYMTLAHNAAAKGSGSRNIKQTTPRQSNEEALNVGTPFDWPPKLKN